MNKNIVERGAIWDLHIHTCSCSKAVKSKKEDSFGNYNVSEYVKKIIQTFEANNDLKLFSFTDHNAVNIEVYEEYISQGGKVEFVVGVEVDVLFGKDMETLQHLVIYFNIHKNNFRENISKIKEINNATSLERDDKDIFNLLDKLLEIKIEFALSPHAFKQDKRGIDRNFTDEDVTNRNISKYTGPFYCFWEASGHSEIARCKEFLNEYLAEESLHVVSFSDSNNFGKLQKSLNSPNQYFESLPSFKGLQLASSEENRISKNQKLLDENNNGNLIGKVEMKSNTVLFSSKLNTIIGGRGSGKSLLLDSIAHSISNSDANDKLEKKRIDFINSYTTNVFDFNGTKIENETFKVEYLNQSYINKLFDKGDLNKNIYVYFRDEFEKLEKINDEDIKANNKRCFMENLTDFGNYSNINISNFINKYCEIDDSKFVIDLKKKDIPKGSFIFNIRDERECEQLKDTYAHLQNCIHKNLRSDVELNNKLIEFLDLYAVKVYEHDDGIVKSSKINESIYNKYSDYKKSISSKSKAKVKIESEFRNEFDKLTKPTKKRVSIVNAFLEVNSDFKKEYLKEKVFDGEDKECFKVKYHLMIESPFEYFVKVVEEYATAKSLGIKNEDLYSKFINYSQKYCFGGLQLKNDKKTEELDEALENFDIKYELKNVIEYRKGSQYVDIINQSPGTQTNILMEYLVFKDTNIPLLIDQPEDNVDNQTIYTQIKKWFIDLKLKRQVIVVTHDANIVINSDTENVIICEQPREGEFLYTYGALEFGNNIETASNILDGGIEAVKRRLMKYGE